MKIIISNLKRGCISLSDRYRDVFPSQVIELLYNLYLFYRYIKAMLIIRSQLLYAFNARCAKIYQVSKV